MIRKGRLGKGFDRWVASYTSSLDFDRTLFEYDILTDMAHLVMLYEQGMVGKADARRILAALKKLEKKGVDALVLDPDFEDIHMAIETYLINEAGDAGGRLHTARSRNDQVACDLRLKARDDLNILSKALIGLIIALLEVAEKNTLTLMPAFTHLQHAQPTTLAHHMLSHIDSLSRNLERLEEAYRRMDLCPLGAGAVTTTSFPIDRLRSAELLGFQGILENSMDAVSSRDYMAEIASIASIISIDISRIAEELILWSSLEFTYIEISDSFASTSSIMPQKKNPDVLEITRARTGLSIGSLASIFTMLRSLPQSYNRDLQEVSPVFFKSLDSVTTSLYLLSRVVETIEVKKDRMNAATINDFSTATELADLLVRKKKLPFRTAHQIVGAVVQRAVQEGLGPAEVRSEFIDNVAKSLTGKKAGLSHEEVSTAMTPLLAVKARKVVGGPAPKMVETALSGRFDFVMEKEKSLSNREERLRSSKKMLLKRIDSIMGG